MSKMIPHQVKVPDFLKTIDDEQKLKDTKELIKIMRKVSGKPPVMWGSSIIGFDSVHYKYESGREGDMGAIGFSPRKANLVIYAVDGINKYKDLLDKLGPHKIGKACLYIKRLSDVNIKVLEEIIENSYKYVMSRKTDMHRAEK